MQDITGIKFGKLTPIEINKRVGNKTYWLCKCDCGNLCSVRIDQLKSGRTKSCGCLAIERAKENSIQNPNKKHYFNHFEEKEDCYWMYDNDKRHYTIVDKEMKSALENYYWSLGTNGYWRRQKRGEDSFIYLHRFVYITNTHEVLRDDEVVDHINRDKGCNLFSNLRRITHAENSINVDRKGISKSRLHKKFSVNICVEGKSVYFGYYASELDAVRVYKYVHKTLYKDLSPYCHEAVNIDGIELTKIVKERIKKIESKSTIK